MFAYDSVSMSLFLAHSMVLNAYFQIKPPPLLLSSLCSLSPHFYHLLSLSLRIRHLMVQGIWAKVLSRPSITLTQPHNAVTPFIQSHLKSMVTHRHRYLTAGITPTRTNTMVIPTRIDSHTMLFSTPVHTHTMALTTQPSHTQLLSSQTHIQAHSCRIRTFSYRLAPPRAMPSHPQSMSP